MEEEKVDREKWNGVLSSGFLFLELVKMAGNIVLFFTIFESINQSEVKIIYFIRLIIGTSGKR